MISGLEHEEFMRYGSIHRNTYVNLPALLHPTLQLKANKLIFFAGQIMGVERYVESSTMGLIEGVNAARISMGQTLLSPLMKLLWECL